MQEKFRTDEELDKLISHLVSIATISSPSSTGEIALDILGSAADKKLVGEVAFFTYLQDSIAHYAMGQITEIELKNIWLEDPTIKSLVRQKAQVNPISGHQDTHLGKMAISAVFGIEDDGFVPSIMGTVPPTGTSVNRITDEILDHLLKKYKRDIFYVGNVYGSKTKLPVWFKHFGMQREGGTDGAGEAYHIGIFGKTGSGKSTLAKMILVAYAKHPEMAIFVIDPVGEFSKSARGVRGTERFNLNLSEILSDLDKTLDLRNVTGLVLDEWELFDEILYESRFFNNLSIDKGENRKEGVQILTSELRRYHHVTLNTLSDRNSFDAIWGILSDEHTQEDIFKTSGPRRRLARKIEEIRHDNVTQNEIYTNDWLPITSLFREGRPGSTTIQSLVGRTYDIGQADRPVIIIDLSNETADAAGLFWNDTIQALVIKNLLDHLYRLGLLAYRENRTLGGTIEGLMPRRSGMFHYN